METHEQKNELIMAMTDMAFYPTILEEPVSTQGHQKFPLAKIAAWGTAFEPLTAVFQRFVHGNGYSGLYRVIVPNGGKLAEFKDGSGFLGSVLDKSGAVGGGQARLRPLACDPTMLFMAMALASIDKKLDRIQETQQEILEFLVQKEKSKLRGNLNFLADVLNNYKHNWSNEKYKNNNHVKVLDIRQAAEQSILFYREQIDKKVKKTSLFHSDKGVKEMLKKTQAEFKEYQLALYLHSFSSFLEVLLLENFAPEYLDAIARKIEDYAFQYREFYTACYNRVEGYAQTSVQSYLLKGLASTSKVAGDAVAKIPGVNKAQLDETLIAAGSRLGDFNTKRTDQIVEQLANTQSSVVRPFVENIRTINRLHNQPLELLFDGENIYTNLLAG